MIIFFQCHKVIRSLKKSQKQRKCHIEIELWVKWSVLRFCHLGHVVQSRRSFLSLPWHKLIFMQEAKKKRFSAKGLCCGQNLKNENFKAPSSILRQKIAPKSAPHSSTQIIHLWCCHNRCCCDFLHSLLWNSQRQKRSYVVRHSMSLLDPKQRACSLSGQSIKYWLPSV